MEKYKHGDIINGMEYLPSAQRKTILLMSDDLRMPSGVGTVSREIVLGTAHHFNWIQIGGAINHPELGKKIELSDAVNMELNMTDSNVIIYPMSGYGDVGLLRMLMKHESIDAIMPYTDPRFWGWLFNNEHEIRQQIPMFFYHVWDDLPFPHYNEQFYESCDWIGCISKQTYNIVKNVWKKHPPKDWQVSYIPHGIPERFYYPIDISNQGKEQKVPTGKKIKNQEGKEVMETKTMLDYELLLEMQKKLFGEENLPEFVLLYINRNVRRKMTSDVILAYNKFCNSLPEEDAKKCALVMHTQPMDEAGTNLLAVINDLKIKHKVVFDDNRLEPRFINLLYNIADVTINIASNEGFGLGTAESLMAGTPIVVNVTGGLQDQCGFKKEDGTYLTADDYNAEFGSNHKGKYKEHGEWVKPVFPSTISLQGSIPTPYIFDDRCNWEDAADALRHWYDMGRDERKRRGKLGRDYVMNKEIGMNAEEMCRRFMQDMTTAFEKWEPRDRFTLFKI